MLESHPEGHDSVKVFSGRSLHCTGLFCSPTTSPHMKATLEGLQRSLTKLVDKRVPVIRLTAARILELVSFLHFSEIVNIRHSNVSRAGLHENDQLRQ